MVDVRGVIIPFPLLSLASRSAWSAVLVYGFVSQCMGSLLHHSVIEFPSRTSMRSQACQFRKEMFPLFRWDCLRSSRIFMQALMTVSCTLPLMFAKDVRIYVFRSTHD